MFLTGGIKKKVGVFVASKRKLGGSGRAGGSGFDFFFFLKKVPDALQTDCLGLNPGFQIPCLRSLSSQY